MNKSSNNELLTLYNEFTHTYTQTIIHVSLKTNNFPPPLHITAHTTACYIQLTNMLSNNDTFIANRWKSSTIRINIYCITQTLLSIARVHCFTSLQNNKQFLAATPYYGTYDSRYNSRTYKRAQITALIYITQTHLSIAHASTSPPPKRKQQVL